MKGEQWEEPTWTHKGWFLMAPVYIANLESEGPELKARHWTLEWWFDANQMLAHSIMWVLERLDPDYVALYPIRVTGRLQ